ncbi:MAG: hypothetical protein ACSLE0_11220 [Chitinophagaceae bacterium]
METTKIRLSPEEAALVIRQDWILTKNNVIQKTQKLFASLQADEQQSMELYKDYHASAIVESSPKISKGENYNGLPYLVLDYPRCFSKEDVFAIRMLFWWGNFFSGTLHLSGIYKKKYEEKIIHSFDSLKSNDYFICVNEDPWEHHFENDNYLPLRTMNHDLFKKWICEKSFIKLSKKFSIAQWNDAEKKLLEMFRQFMNSLMN